MKIVPTLVVVFLSTFSFTFSQKKWVSLSENENYVARHECSFTQSGEHFIMFGGREQAQRLDIYDYKKNSWKQGAKAPKEFNHFQATEFQGLVWVVGAFQTNNFPNEIPETHIYIYHPLENMWIMGPEIPEHRRRGGAGLIVHNRKFYLVGGNTKGHNGGYVPWFDEYDPIKNSWKELPDAPHARDHFSAVKHRGKIYAVSGRLSGGEGGVFKPLIKEVDVYDFISEKWTTLPAKLNIPTPRAGASVCVFNESIFVIGGEGEEKGPSFKTVEALTLKKYKWKKFPPLNFSRHGTQAIVSGESIFVAGGSPNQGGGRQHNMEVFGENNPHGKALEASYLSVPKKITLEKYESSMVVLNNTGGNVANFISEISIEGHGYEIKSKAKQFLIPANVKMGILVEKTASKAYAILKIRFNKNKVRRVILN